MSACVVCSPTKEKTTSTSPEHEEDDGASAAQEEQAHLGIKRVKKEEDRKAIIEADPLSGEVKPESAYCKGCQSWVKLSTQTTYSLHHWRNHASKCHCGMCVLNCRGCGGLGWLSDAFFSAFLGLVRALRPHRGN